jgi:WD40 repeat protein
MFSNNSRYLASGSQDMTVRLWNLKMHKEIAEPFKSKKKINSIAFSPDNNYLGFESEYRTVKLWNIEQQMQEKNFNTAINMRPLSHSLLIVFIWLLLAGIAQSRFLGSSHRRR